MFTLVYLLLSLRQNAASRPSLTAANDVAAQPVVAHAA
jgi:hypothetical protein